ncbi:unnamed protein product, partial [Heterosigma akashiwo]
NISLYRPNLPISYGTHHTKMAVLFYDTGVRVAIMTNNFIEQDWQGKSQGIWVQDFPLKADGLKEAPSDFESDLVNYIHHLGGPTKTAADEIRNFSFQSANTILIPCVPGYHQHGTMHRYGHLKLKSALQHERFASDERNCPVVCQCSSLGSFNEAWLKELLQSMLAGEYENLTTSSIASGEQTSLSQMLQFIWPSVSAVKNSMMGYASGGSIPGSIKNMFGSVENARKNNPKPFLAQVLHLWKGEELSGRNTAMPHIKTYCRWVKKEHKPAEYLWFLLTSCNLSKAAWGTLQKNKSQLMIRSYEMGVLFLRSHFSGKHHTRFSCTPLHPKLGAVLPIPSTPGPLKRTFSLEIKFVSSFSLSQAQRERYYSQSESDGRVVDTLCFPVPYVLPAPKYGKDDWPWVWDRPYHEPDILGQTWQC